MSAELPEIGWIDLPGVVNMRDLGGKPTADGRATVPGRVIRTDNLQDLPPESVRRLVDEFGVTDVVDLRTNVERASTGNGPLKAEEVTFHELTLYSEDSTEHGIPDVDDDTEPSLPWQDEFTEHAKQDLGHEQHLADHYSGYLERRPDNVLRALRAIAQAPGTVLVHCAAGKDRTGTLVAIALLLCGADPEAVVADYAASSERVEQILERLVSTPTYAAVLGGQPPSWHMTRPETMASFIEHVQPGGDQGPLRALLAQWGWTDADTERLRARLRD